MLYHVSRDAGREGPTYLVEIGEEPGPIYCEPLNVYIAMEFSSADTLSEVHVKKIGTCL